MLFDILHEISFRFGNRVHFDPMSIRMRPRSDSSQTLLLFELEAFPPPARSDYMTDLDGNTESRFWFEGTHDTMRLRARSKVETMRSNPFDFLFADSQALSLPFLYPERLSSLLTPYLTSPRTPERGPLFHRFLEDLRRESRMETIPFLTLLSRQLPECLAMKPREEGPPQSPEETLRKGSGSCRDFSVLAMEICRSFQIASRFTSGYHLPLPTTTPSLHGWIEVYLPEIGWRGIDPSEGLLTADHHIALASSPDPSLTLPTEGSYRGEGTSTLHSAIRIDMLSEVSTLTH